MLRDSESGRVRGLYHGSRRLDEPEKARLVGNLNRLLHWHNMRVYKQEGFRYYDWGGISADRGDGRARFKMSFGGDVVEEYSYLCAGSRRLGLMVRNLFELASARGRMIRMISSSGHDRP